MRLRNVHGIEKDMFIDQEDKGGVEIFSIILPSYTKSVKPYYATCAPRTGNPSVLQFHVSPLRILETLFLYPSLLPSIIECNLVAACAVLTVFDIHQTPQQLKTRPNRNAVAVGMPKMLASC